MAQGRKDIAQDGKATQFSSDNQPGNRGRRPSVLTYIKGSGLALDDYRKLLTNLIWEYDLKELSNLLKDKNNSIPMGLSIVLGALIDDQKNKSIANYEKFMNRVFGKSTQGIDLKTSGNMEIISEIISMTPEERKKRIEELMKEAKIRVKKTENEPEKSNRE
jgi:hypothetical protein